MAGHVTGGTGTTASALAGVTAAAMAAFDEFVGGIVNYSSAALTVAADGG